MILRKFVYPLINSEMEPKIVLSRVSVRESLTKVANNDTQKIATKKKKENSKFNCQSLIRKYFNKSVDSKAFATD